MSLQVDKGTTPTIRGTVVGGNISGWVLTLAGLPPQTAFVKSSADASQILVLDVTAGTFEVYLTLEDTDVPRNITVELRGQHGSLHYLLARDVIQINV